MSEKIPRQESQLSPQGILQAGAGLVEHFGVVIDPNVDPTTFVEALAQINPRYQGGHELLRWQLEADQTRWTPESNDAIMQAAEQMGMLKTETPLIGQYDVVIALGGARWSNLDRARYAAEAIKGGRATASQLVVAGSMRVLNETERQSTDGYAPGAATEVDLCIAAARIVARENPGLVTSVLHVQDERAGTPDVIKHVLTSSQVSCDFSENPSIAAVTTQIYQASTALDLARVAREFGITQTFAAGNPSDPDIIAKRTPATYLSEVIRTLQAATYAVEAGVIDG